ncbi:MAG TPA: UDP-N-acetylmuramoyl-tripeptide--D-alanyl-D-alanine ligase [Vicinamibacterales bacterium]|nr:UDP-N-acetylmuramoyl-tripeptide--D-alanyl-D-alanine ligase [Vicinamibacterales bacterium]
MEDVALIASWVARAMGGRIVAGEPERPFDSVSIDTRTLAAGALYIGIRGDRFDGADFAGKAVDAGAAGVVVPASAAEGLRAGGRAVVIAVDDTTTALQSLAREVRRVSGSKVVAITGSAGKTTTKEVAAEFLAARYRVIRNRGNLNNHIGLPLSLIDLRQRPDIAVVELGMNHAGEISTLVAIAEPDVRVWTNVGEAHLGFFESEDAIADAKAEILERARPETLLVANADDDRIAARTGRFAGRLRTFGMERAADVRATAIRDRGIEGMSARVETPKGCVDVETPLVGRANVANILAATAVAIDFDVPLPAIAERAAALKPAPHRGEVVKLATGVTVIDDSYNANPTATKRAIEVLAATPAARRIAVLGEMLELGARAVALHEEVGRAAARANVDALMTVGGLPAAALADASIRAGLSRASVQYFATSEEAADAAASLVRSGDLVLVKGSRGVSTDLVVDRLKATRVTG